MQLTRQQLDTITARAFPGERLRETRELAPGRYALAIGGERLLLLAYPSADAARAAIAALRLLRGEIDLPVPQLRAADADGETTGTAYALVDELGGEPLARVAGRMTEDQQYAVGRRLGEVACRFHRLALDSYGPLGDGQAGPADEHGYALARLGTDLRRCDELGLINHVTADALRGWFEREFRPIGRQAALIHGGLSPDTVLVRPSESGWRLSGVLGWERAAGWAPAWEHVTLLAAADDSRWFSLRVGYGNGYDDQTRRAYEQVREAVLRPYRALLLLERLLEGHTRGDVAAAARARVALLGLIELLAG